MSSIGSTGSFPGFGDGSSTFDAGLIASESAGLNGGEPAPSHEHLSPRWRSGLEMLGAAGEVVGGGALALSSVGTGPGAFAGVPLGLAAVGDGAARLVHGVADFWNNAHTDSTLSQAAQMAGYSQQEGNQFDAGVNVALTVPSAVLGTGSLLINPSIWAKGLGAYGGAAAADGLYHQAEFAVTGQAIRPLLTQGLMDSTGLSETAAAYTQAGTSLIAPLALGWAARGPHRPAATVAQGESQAVTAKVDPLDDLDPSSGLDLKSATAPQTAPLVVPPKYDPWEGLEDISDFDLASMGVQPASDQGVFHPAHPGRLAELEALRPSIPGVPDDYPAFRLAKGDTFDIYRIAPDLVAKKQIGHFAGKESADLTAIWTNKLADAWPYHDQVKIPKLTRAGEDWVIQDFVKAGPVRDWRFNGTQWADKAKDILKADPDWVSAREEVAVLGLDHLFLQNEDGIHWIEPILGYKPAP